MFDSARYATRGIAHAIDLELQLTLWSLIDELSRRGQELDYLQVFELSKVFVQGEVYQEIVHRQEVPPLKNKHLIRLDSQPINAMVWVIDSGDYATMLCPEEY